VLNSIDFKIPFKELKRTSIKEVSMPGINQRDSVIVFKVNQSHNKSILVIWDLKANMELDSYDVSSKAKAMFDANE
jgi:hypothetical protein